MRRGRASGLVGAVLGGVLAVGAVGWAAAPAWAHNYLVGSSPAAGETIIRQPEVISVTTNDSLLDLGGAGSGNALQISGPAGESPSYYGDGCVTLLGPTVETEAALGQPGEYTVTWQVVSTDGHPISGEYTFRWEPEAGQPLAEGSAQPPGCGGSSQATAPPAADGDDSETDPGVALADVWWIAGILGAVVLAVAVALFFLRRTPTRTPAVPAAPSDPTSDPAPPPYRE